MGTAKETNKQTRSTGGFTHRTNKTAPHPTKQTDIVNETEFEFDSELLTFPARWIDGESVYCQDTEVQNISWLNKHLEVKRTRFGNLYYLTNPTDGNKYKVYFVTPRRELNETFIISWRANIVTNARAVMLRNF